MSQTNLDPDDALLQEMRTILKPMVDKTIEQRPQDPVIILYNIIIDRIYDSLVAKIFRD
jgi:hypothetical protein